MECCSIFKDRVFLSKAERQESRSTVGVTNAEGPPVPIPNTEVKLCSGEDTLRETVRENSSMPTQVRERIKPFPDPEKGENNYNLWGCSSAGRAPALQAGGHGFESHHLHQSFFKA